VSRKIKRSANELLDGNSAAANVIDPDDQFFLDCLVDLALQQLMFEVECDCVEKSEESNGNDAP
jgi:hypothetical protein